MLKETSIVFALVISIILVSFLFEFTSNTQYNPNDISTEDMLKIRSELENYKNGALNKNIPLFMSTFSPSYPDLAGKFNEITDFLNNYEFQTFRYEISTTYKDNNNKHQIVMLVDWKIQLKILKEDRIITTKEVNRFRFHKIIDSWKIIEMSIL